MPGCEHKGTRYALPPHHHFGGRGAGVTVPWNARINLTAIRDPQEIVTRHFGESFFAARHLFPSRTAERITLADLGSGAGFPGLAIKLWRPQVVVTLVESNHKKATFLREIVRALTLTDIDIQQSRAETLTGQTFDVVTLRAVERFEAILPVAATLLSPAGRLALLIGSGQQAVVRTLLPHVSWREPVRVPCSESRILMISESAPANPEPS